jgi:hypothetical protein
MCAGNTMAVTETTPSAEDRTWAAAAHSTILLDLVSTSTPLLGLVGSLIIYILSRSRGAFARDQATEALNFQLTLLLVVIALLVSAYLIVRGDPLWRFITPPSLIVVLLAAVAAVFGSIVAGIVAALRAQRGILFRYRVAIPFVRH